MSVLLKNHLTNAEGSLLKGASMSFASLGITYNDYVITYLNKKDFNGMWWNTDTIAEATGTDYAVLSRYRIEVLNRAWKIYQETGTQATVDQLVDVSALSSPSRALSGFWADFIWTQAAGTLLAILKGAVKSESTKERIKTLALKIRDLISLLYPEESFNAAKARKALELDEAA